MIRLLMVGEKILLNSKLTPRLKDIICAYFFMLGVDLNVHAHEIPEGYIDRN